MIEGAPMLKSDCQSPPGRSCRCRPKCAVCGHGPHAAIHGGVMGKPGYVWGHEYQPLPAAEARVGDG